MITQNVIETKLITIVAQSLEIPETEVTLKSLLMNELDAESIDILDIRFAIEQEFGIKFDNTEIRSILQKVIKQHKITEKEVPGLFSVGTLYDYIVHKLAL